ncbi:TetR family transcriptional regulator [Flavisolibacter sp. BT320]|nr:TetR family transcriptional regulator [Flavisolibacter longurius]
MSKLKLNTKDKIRDKALELFNERGIEYVGLRELAALLNIRVGNITYYFPTKDDLVYELSQELRKANSAIMVVHENMTMRGFLEMLHVVFQNHHRFRCLLRSFVHLMQQNKPMAAAYQTTQANRRDMIGAQLEGIKTGGYLQISEEEKAFLLSSLTLISRFWISEAAISFREMSSEEQIRYYLSLVANLLMPYATTKAKTEIHHFLASL